jgi:hypothetical protein
MDISQFKGLLGAGGARPNQFRVILTFPSLVGANIGEASLLVTGASLPASNVNPTLLQYRGREVKLAGERVFDPFTITIVNDTEFKLRRPFERWMNLMNNRVNNTGRTTPRDYQTQIDVVHLDRNDVALQTYQLVDAFPINMSEVALQYGQNDVVEEFTVTFQYQHYTTFSGSRPDETIA